MNERIKLLAKQAKIDYDLRPEIARAPVWIGTDEELEKFAESIILECADIAGDDWDTAGRAILKHFGVNR